MSDPASVTWDADGVVPVVTITSPSADGVTVMGPGVTFEFSSEPGATYMCSFIGLPFEPCASGDTLGFADGMNDVRVQATDKAGNLSALARRTFIVDSVGPKVMLAVTPVDAINFTRASGVVTYTSPTATADMAHENAAWRHARSGAPQPCTLDGQPWGRPRAR